MLIPYIGNSDYCYTHSLSMALLAAGAERAWLPEPGFLECLTTMPFGKMYLDRPSGPLTFFSNAEVDPDRGLTHALETLGWTCDEQRGAAPAAALAALRQAVAEAPVLAGPLDMGYLSYHPHHRALAGADHFLVVLAVSQDDVLLHDPQKYPCVRLPLADFLRAWRAERIGYLQAPYTLRARFRRVAQPTRSAMIERTLSLVRQQLAMAQEGPTLYSGAPALCRLIAALEDGGHSASLLRQLADFVLPLAARRLLDAAHFLDEAGLTKAASLLQEEALLAGAAQYPAAQRRVGEVVACLERLLSLEMELSACL
jgi:hypothetical protein